MSLSSDGSSLLIVVAAIVLLLASVVFLGFASRYASRRLDGVDLESRLLQSFRGGLRWPLPARLGTTNTPPVLVGLEMHEWGVRVEARWSWLRRFVPSWCVRYEEILVAERARRSARLSRRGSDGVRFRAPVCGAPLIFWTSATGSLLDSLEAHGVAVVRVATITRVWTNS
jgi:hypothetical protein